MKAIGRFCVKLAGIGSTTFLYLFLASSSPTSSLLYAQSVSFAGAATTLPFSPIVGTQPSVNFGSVNACSAGKTTPAPCSQSMTLTYQVTEGGNLGTPAALTLGAPNLDFKLASGSTCSGAVTTGSKCVVNVIFAPIAPGARNGAVVLQDASGNPVTTTNIYGTGVGPAIAFSPASLITLTNHLGGPMSIAEDGFGNLFVCAGTLYEILAAGGYTTVKFINTYPFGINDVSSVAVDGSGNLFVIATYGGTVNELLAASGYTTEKTLGIRFSQLNGVALDGSGNVFVADVDSDEVREILAASGYTTLRKLGGDFHFAGSHALAVDASGNVFVAAGEYPSVIYEIPAVGNYSTVKTLQTGVFSYPAGIAVDASENVFVADYGGSYFVGHLFELPAANGYTTVDPVGYGFQHPWGVTVDGGGNLLIADWAGAIQEIQRTQPPPRSWGATPVDQTSAPQRVEIQNIGNATLTATGLTVSPSDFLQVAGSGTPQDCASNSSLEPNQTCNLSISFAPTEGGKLTGAAVLTDNAYSVVQTIPLAGIGAAGGKPAALVSATAKYFGSIPFGTAETKPVTITNIGGGTLTVVPSIPAQSFAVQSSTCGAGITEAQSCTLQIQFSPITLGTHQSVLTLATNGATNPAVTLRGTGVGIAPTVNALQFGTIPVGTTKVLPLTLTNYEAPGTVTITTSSGHNFNVLMTAQNTCLAGISAGQSCTLPVEFAPSYPSLHYDLLTITASSGSVAVVGLKGTAQ